MELIGLPLVGDSGIFFFFVVQIKAYHKTNFKNHLFLHERASQLPFSIMAHKCHGRNKTMTKFNEPMARQRELSVKQRKTRGKIKLTHGKTTKTHDITEKLYHGGGETPRRV